MHKDIVVLHILKDVVDQEIDAEKLLIVVMEGQNVTLKLALIHDV